MSPRSAPTRVVRPTPAPDGPPLVPDRSPRSPSRAGTTRSPLCDCSSPEEYVPEIVTACSWLFGRHKRGLETRTCRDLYPPACRPHQRHANTTNDGSDGFPDYECSNFAATCLSSATELGAPCLVSRSASRRPAPTAGRDGLLPARRAAASRVLDNARSHEPSLRRGPIWV